MTNKLKFWVGAALLAISTHGLAANGNSSESLTAEQMFQVLASEIGLQRGEAGIA